MKIHTVWIQRTQSYPGQFLPELVAAIDENGNEDNSDYIQGELKDQLGAYDTDAAAHVILDLPQLTWERIKQALGVATIESECSIWPQ